MTNIEHVDLEAIVRWQEALTPKARALRKSLSHWWLDVHEGVGIQPGTRTNYKVPLRICASGSMPLRDW